MQQLVDARCRGGEWRPAAKGVRVMDEFLIGVMIVMLLLLGGFGATVIVNSEWRDETVKRGLAQYCPDTGEWAWKGECNE